MAKERTLKVVIAGDADKLDREVRRAGGSLDKLGKQTRLTATASSKGFTAMKVGATGAAAGLAGLAIAGKRVVQSAMESEKSQAALAAQLKASGISYKAHAEEIDAVIRKHSQLAGVDDEDLQDAFTALVRSTGSVNVAMKDMGVVTDLARAKNIDVAKAATMVAKVHAGAVTPLKAMGIEFVKTTENVDKLKASNDKITPAQLAAAKAADKQANSQRALGLVQDKVKGQAEAYGKTTAGAMDRAEVAVEGVEEAIGGALAPTVEKAANKLANFVNEMQDGTGQGGRFVRKLKDIWQEVKPIVTWLGRATKNVANFTAEHPNVGKLAAAVVGVGAAVKALRFASAATGFTSLLKGGRTVMKRLVGVFATQGAVAGAAAGRAAAGGEGLTSASTFNKMRDGGKRLGRVMGRGLAVGVVVGVATLADSITKSLYDKIGKGGTSTGLGQSIWRKLKGDGIGKAMRDAAPSPDGLGMGAIGGAGSGGAGLMGANPALGPFAAFGAKFGLHVSSGSRPGAITSSNNPSFHGTGEAIDVSGPSAGMLRYFRAMKSRFGGKLAELIFTPGGVGVKNGRPHRYTGKVAADHFDHVHVALDLGQPGPGIGTLNRSAKSRAGDGPGRGGIMTADQVARLAESVGLPGVTFAQIARGESGYNPRAVGHDPGGTTGLGLWQITTKFNDDIIKRFGGREAMFIPRQNARAAKAIYDRQGIKAWYGTKYMTGTNLHYKGNLGGYANGKGGGSSGGSGGGTPDRSEAQERSGSRAVNRIVAKFSKGIRSATGRASSIGGAIEAAEGGYGRSERFFGQVIGGQKGVYGEEDLNTAEGRSQRVSELGELKKLKTAQLARMKRRAAALKTAIGKYEGLLKKLRAARGKAKGAKRAKMGERIKSYDDKLVDLKAELRTLGESIADTQLDIGDLTKDMRDVASGGAEEPVSASDKAGTALGDIDLQERAGLLTPAQAQAARIATLQQALAGGFGVLDQRQQWELMGQLRDAQQASAQAVTDNTSALVDLKRAIDEQNAIAMSTVGTQLRQASRALGDLVSGELGGRVAARGAMPNSGLTMRL